MCSIGHNRDRLIFFGGGCSIILVLTRMHGTVLGCNAGLIIVGARRISEPSRVPIKDAVFREDSTSCFSHPIWHRINCVSHVLAWRLRGGYPLLYFGKWSYLSIQSLFKCQRVQIDLSLCLVTNQWNPLISRILPQESTSTLAFTQIDCHSLRLVSELSASHASPMLDSFWGWPANNIYHIMFLYVFIEYNVLWFRWVFATTPKKSLPDPLFLQGWP